MARTDFDERSEYRGGALTEQKPRVVLRYPCFADGCPMPGTIWPGAGIGGTGDQPGTCAWHYGVQPQDIPKVTRALRDWACVTYEVNEARRACTGDLASNPAALKAAFATAWERLQPLVVGQWEDELSPGNIHTSKGLDCGPRLPESYADWARRLERFVGARIAEVLSTHRRRAA